MAGAGGCVGIGGILGGHDGRDTGRNAGADCNGGARARADAARSGGDATPAWREAGRVLGTWQCDTGCDTLYPGFLFHARLVFRETEIRSGDDETSILLVEPRATTQTATTDSYTVVRESPGLGQSLRWTRTGTNGLSFKYKQTGYILRHLRKEQ